MNVLNMHNVEHVLLEGQIQGGLSGLQPRPAAVC
jgi:hypothetical protein